MLQDQLWQAHIQRRLRIAENAVIDRPINLRDRAKRAPRKINQIQEISTVISTEIKEPVPSIEQQFLEAHRLLEKLFNPPIIINPVHRIIDLISRTENIPKNKIIGHRRFPELCLARQIAFHLAFELTDRSYPQIARCFNDRDHTTILHGNRKIKAMRAADPIFDEKIRWYEDQIAGI